MCSAHGPDHHVLVGPVIIGRLALEQQRPGSGGKTAREGPVLDTRNWLCCPLRAQWYQERHGMALEVAESASYRGSCFVGRPRHMS